MPNATEATSALEARARSKPASASPESKSPNPAQPAAAPTVATPAPAPARAVPNYPEPIKFNNTETIELNRYHEKHQGERGFSDAARAEWENLIRAGKLVDACKAIIRARNGDLISVCKFLELEVWRVKRYDAQAPARAAAEAAYAARRKDQPVTVVTVPDSAELVAARAAVAEATAAVEDEQKKLAQLETDAASIDFGSSGAKGRLSQAVRDLALQREFTALAGKHLEKLKAELAEAERADADNLHQRRAKQLRTAAERYIALCSDVDSAIAVLANAIAALGPTVAELNSLRDVCPSFTRNLFSGGRRSDLLDAAIAHVGEEARQFFGVDLMPPSRRRSLRENAERGLQPIFAQTGDKE